VDSKHVRLGGVVESGSEKHDSNVLGDMVADRIEILPRWAYATLPKMAQTNNTIIAGFAYFIGKILSCHSFDRIRLYLFGDEL
jgi:hypothetical protein